MLLVQLSCVNKRLSNTDFKNDIHRDSTLYATLVEYGKTNGLTQTDPKKLKSSLRIDPRSIDTAYSFVGKLEAKDLYASKKQLNLRRQIIKNHNLTIANVIEDQKCSNYGGLRPPPGRDDSIEIKIPSHCKNIGLHSFITIIFGQPEITADSNCANINSRQLEDPQATCWEIKAIEYTSSSELIFNLYLIEDPEEGWNVVHKKNIWGAISKAFVADHFSVLVLQAFQ
ncbi:hypothetical protein Asal01_01583 [Fodinibius salicampi]